MAHIVGFLDAIRGSCILGWVRDFERPGRRMRVEALVDGQVVSETLANAHRPDVQDHGFDDGCYGFALLLPSLVMDGHEHSVTVRVAEDPAPVIASRQVILQKMTFEPLAPDGFPYPHEIAICAICKNEAPYLREWVAYHRVIGVERFLVFDNGSSDASGDLLDRLARAGVVERVPWLTVPGQPPQKPAYEEGLRRLRYEARWIAFIDLDEFIHPLAHDDLPSLLAEYSGAAGLVLPWRTFGSSGEAAYRDDLLIRRFRHRAPEAHPINHAVKCIVQGRSIQEVGIHAPQLVAGNLVDEHFIVAGSRSEPERHTVPEASKVVLHHYFSKSREEWVSKRQRGRATRSPGDSSFIRPDQAFDDHDRNEVLDERILRFESRVRDEMSKLSDP